MQDTGKSRSRRGRSVSVARTEQSSRSPDAHQSAKSTVMHTNYKSDKPTNKGLQDLELSTKKISP
jgi:hypothetical protein